MKYLGKAIYVPAVAILIQGILGVILLLLYTDKTSGAISPLFIWGYAVARSSMILNVALIVMTIAVVVSFIAARSRNMPRHFPAREFFMMCLWALVTNILVALVRSEFGIQAGGEWLGYISLLALAQALFIIPFATITFMFGYFASFIMKKAPSPIQ